MMMRMVQFLLVMLVFTAFAEQGALAQQASKTATKAPTDKSAPLKPFPKIEKLSAEQFTMISRAVHLIFPEKDKYLDVEMRVPSAWTQRGETQLKTLQSTERLFGEIAWFDGMGKGKTRAYMTVKSSALDHEVTAKSWLTQRVFDNAFTLRSMHERSFDDVEAMYVTYDQLVTYVTWARAMIVGPRVVLVEFHLPSDTWTRDKDLQARVMQSVKIKNDDPGRIEQLSAFAFLDVATFQYPKSWTLMRNIIRSPDFFRVALFNALNNEAPTVQISVQAARIGGQVSMDEMKREEQIYLDGQKVVLREKQPAPNFIPDTAAVKNLKNTVYTVSSRLGLYETDLNSKPVTKEYWLTTFDKNGTAFVISMLVPSRHSMYADWARATRTYQIVIETLTGSRLGVKEKGLGAANPDTAIPFLQ